MKSYLSPFLALALMACTSTAKGEVKVPDDLRFIFGEWNLMTPSERNAKQRKLQETPNLGERLCELLWAYYREGNDECVGVVIGALMSRDDIPPEQLKRITAEMRRLAGMNIRDVGKMGVLNMLYGVRILERYPSPEHEELALLLLNSEDSMIRSNAATTLGRIGTERSVEPMRKHYDPFRYIKTDPPHEGAQVFESEQMLLARVAKAGTNVPALSKKTVSEPDASPINEEQTSLTLWGIIVVLMVAGGLLWLLLKRRS